MKKICRTCEQLLPFDEFRGNCSTLDKKCHDCRACSDRKLRERKGQLREPTLLVCKECGIKARLEKFRKRAGKNDTASTYWDICRDCRVELGISVERTRFQPHHPAEEYFCAPKVLATMPLVAKR